MKFYQDIVLLVNEKKKMSAKDDPCWNGYHMVGTKQKNGREVPNCVPGKKGVAEGANNITYKQQKGKNKFSIKMSVDGKSAGIFQYDAESGRTIVELDPAFRGQGLGQILILKGIYTAAMLGMDYVEDESRTQMFDRAMDRLVDAGYIVNDDEYWYVTSNGEQFLKQGVAEETKPAAEPDVISMPHTETDFNVYHSYTVRGAGEHHDKMPKRWFKHLPNAISFGRATAKSLSTE
jgi:GNAT superfamily N-acetyltransferase